MINAEPMTEKSWILYEKTTRKGLMRLTNDEEYTILGGPNAGKYPDLKSLTDKLGEVTFGKIKASAVQEKEIVGEYPIKHDTYHEVESIDSLSLYTKKEGSKDVYAAGYFSVNSKGKWQTSFSPRYKSLEDNEYHGPFKSKMEADQETKMENNK